MDLFSHFIAFYCWCYYKLRITSYILLVQFEGNSFCWSVQLLDTIALQIPILSFYVLATRMFQWIKFIIPVFTFKSWKSHPDLTSFPPVCCVSAISLTLHKIYTLILSIVGFLLFFLAQFSFCCHFFPLWIFSKLQKVNFDFGSFLIFFFFCYFFMVVIFFSLFS